MTTRLRPAGFDARPERPSSLRAQAQRVYRQKSEAALEPKLQPAITPLPSPPPQGGREQAVLGEAQQGVPPEVQETELTQKVRALYEDSVVPVAEIARLAGVAERTLYKYVAKGGWRRRYGGKGLAEAVAKRAAKFKPRPCVTLKGAGGRFIRNADAGKPVRRGLKALDPQGEAVALSRAEQAAALSQEAVARMARLREATSNARVLARVAGVARDLAAIEDGERGSAPRREKKRRRKLWRPMLGSWW